MSLLFDVQINVFVNIIRSSNVKKRKQSVNNANKGLKPGVMQL